MRYIVNSGGYVQEVSFGADILCDGSYCTEYTGKVPSGYDDLVDWFIKEGDKLYRWKIVEGHLTLDSNVPIKSEPGAVFAPAGYGLGDVEPRTSITTTEQLDACRTCGFYRYAIKSSYICGVGFDFGSLLVYPIYTGGCVQELRPSNSNSCVRRYWSNNKWSEWELVGLVMKYLWENVSPTSNFAAQTIPLDLSKYQAVLVLSVRSTADLKVSGVTWVGVGAIPGYLMGTTNQYAVTRREVSATTTGVTFSGFYSANTTNGASNEIPVVIYGINGISW